MANNTIDLVGLDFTSLRDNLKSFLQNNTQFKDLDYEGANIGVLLDVLAYNTYLNGFYTNMVASEMFLDSAQLRDSVVSHAKELNYVPRSFNSAQAKITVDITPTSAVSSVVVPQYTSFTSRVGSNTYTFATNEALVLTNSNNGVFSTTLTVFEGIVATETFVVNLSNTQQRFVLSNPTVDTSSITVTDYEDGGQNIISYVVAEDILAVTDTSRIFFVQGAENQQYEIVFGDDVFGKKPKDGGTLVVKYRISSGELPNGALVFVTDSAIDGHTNVAITTVTSASGGSVSETIDSIKYNAPRSFQAQNRAVTAQDYETLLTNNFSDIQAVSVYGGEDTDPPQYGVVYISVDVFNADGAPLARKNIYRDFLLGKTPLTIRTEFVDPTFMYINVNTNILYDINNTSKSTSDISTLVQAAISSYSQTYLENYKVTMFYSALVDAINQADTSIVSNDTSVSIAVRIIPTTGVNFNTTIETHNELVARTGSVLSLAEAHHGIALTSSPFTYLNASCILVDDLQGNIYIAARKTDYIVELLVKTGTINYTTGKMLLTNFNVSAYEGNYIELIFTPASKNIYGSKNVIMEIAPIDVTVNVSGIKL